MAVRITLHSAARQAASPPCSVQQAGRGGRYARTRNVRALGSSGFSRYCRGNTATWQHEGNPGPFSSSLGGAAAVIARADRLFRLISRRPAIGCTPGLAGTWTAPALAALQRGEGQQSSGPPGRAGPICAVLSSWPTQANPPGLVPLGRSSARFFFPFGAIRFSHGA
jgi:hypothetical protein